MARHSSNVTLQYVEDAWSEAPRSDLQLQNMSTLCEMASATLARVEQVEKAVDDTEERMRQQLAKLSPVEQTSWGKEELRREIRDALIPIAVINHQSGKIHSRKEQLCRERCTALDDSMWLAVVGVS